MEKLNPTLVRGIRRLLKFFRLRFDPEPDVCPTSAITPDDLSWPRVVRRAFSDPIVTHESTGVHGRGTEEVKTNDVTNRVGVGEVEDVLVLDRAAHRQLELALLGRRGRGLAARGARAVDQRLEIGPVVVRAEEPGLAREIARGGRGRRGEGAGGGRGAG